MAGPARRDREVARRSAMGEDDLPTLPPTPLYSVKRKQGRHEVAQWGGSQGVSLAQSAYPAAPECST